MNILRYQQRNVMNYIYQQSLLRHSGYGKMGETISDAGWIAGASNTLKRDKIFFRIYKIFFWI